MNKKIATSYQHQTFKPVNRSVLKSEAIQDKEDIISLTTLFFKNVLGQIPVMGIFTGTMSDYYQVKVTKVRENEIKSALKKINDRLEHVEMTQEAIKYFEESLVFRLEDITQKLISNPSKGFDELIAEYVATALSDSSTPPTAKDLILSSLLSIDSVDLKVMQQIDTSMKFNLQSDQSPGVKVDSLHVLMKNGGIDSIMISRALKRLEAQDLVHPLNPGTATIQDSPSKEGILEGEKSPQYYSGSGFVVSAFGRRFLRFLKLSN